MLWSGNLVRGNEGHPGLAFVTSMKAPIVSFCFWLKPVWYGDSDIAGRER